jgi:hypothetical protein
MPVGSPSWHQLQVENRIAPDRDRLQRSVLSPAAQPSGPPGPECWECRAAVGRHCSWVSTLEGGVAAHTFRSATPLAACPATSPPLRPRSPQSEPRLHPVPHHWHGSAGMLPEAHLHDRPYPKGCRTDSWVRLWLLPVTPSAASEPYSAEWVDSSSISAALATSCVASEAGPLPSTSVTRLLRCRVGGGAH